MAFETLIVDIADHTCLIKLNRPEALNALNAALLSELSQALREAAANERVRCIVLTGSEKAFRCGGRHRRDVAIQLRAGVHGGSVRRTGG